MTERFLELVQAAGRVAPGGPRLAGLTGALAGEDGFLGVFERGETPGVFGLYLTPAARAGVDEGRLVEALAAELEPDRGGGAPGAPRQMTFGGALLGGGEGVTATLLWDDGDTTAAGGPVLLGGLLLRPGAGFLSDPGLYAILQVVQLALSRDRFSARAGACRRALELLADLHPSRLRPGGDEGVVGRALVRLRELVPFDAVALATASADENYRVRYLFPAAFPPPLVREVRAEIRDSLGLEPDAPVAEVFEHTLGDGPPPGAALGGLRVAPVVGPGGEDCGRVGFFSTAPGFFTGHHRALLELVGPAMGAALQALRPPAPGPGGPPDPGADQAKVEAQLGLARRLQSQLLAPCPPPPKGVQVAHRAEMSAAVGGDFFAARAFGRHRYAVAVADVSGKGLPAGIVMAHTRGALWASWDTNPEPRHVLGRLNRVVLDSTDDFTFVTMAVAVVDTRRGQVRFGCAGHEPLLRVTAAGAVQEFTTGDPPLGVLEGHPFRGGVLDFEPGDRLVLYTDGVTEAVAPDGSRFGRARLDALLRAAPPRAPGVLAAVFDALAEFSGGLDQKDDCTALVLSRGAAGAGRV